MALLLCRAASAGWVRVGGTHKDDGYLDVAGIGPSGQTVTPWTLKDFMVDRQIPEGAYRSVRIKKQIDCLVSLTGTDPCGPHIMRLKRGKGAPGGRGRGQGNARG